MAWISVYQEVDGPKLRRLSRSLGTCKAEALGILNFLWFWGMNNADETGKTLEADRIDIEEVFASVTKLPADKVVDALFDTGWIEDRDGCIYIHDWDVWQEQWYKLQKTRKYDAERKRRAKASEAQRSQPKSHPEEPSPKPTQLPPDVEKDASEGNQKQPEGEQKKPKGPVKKAYAEFVHMTEENYGKLLKLYGKRFTDACISELDLYKGSKGKAYKDDYRAILSWTVDRCKEKYPGLLQQSKADMVEEPSDENPFEE